MINLWCLLNSEAFQIELLQSSRLRVMNPGLRITCTGGIHVKLHAEICGVLIETDYFFITGASKK